MRAVAMALGDGTRFRPLNGRIRKRSLSFCISFLKRSAWRVETCEDVDLLDRRSFHIVVEGKDGERARASVEEFRGRTSGWRKEPA